MATVSNTARTTRVLELLARLDPRWWDVPPPVPPHPIHVPVPVPPNPIRDLIAGIAFADRDEVALNPQPLPPRDGLYRAVRDTSAAVAEATIAASMAGRKPAEILKDVGDDLCPPPRKIPWPKKWPVPTQLQQQRPEDLARLAPAVQATAALVFQTYADRTADKALSTAFAALADRLVDTALKTAAVTS